MKHLQNLVIGFEILYLQLKDLPNSHWPDPKDYTPTSLDRNYNRTRLDKVFIKDDEAPLPPPTTN